MSDNLWAKCKGTASQAELRRQMNRQPATAQKGYAYPEQIELPFNFALIRDNFEFRIPPADMGTEAGYWIILQGGNVVMRQDGDGLALPEGDLPASLAPQQDPLGIGFWHGRPLRACTISSNAEIPSPYVTDGFNAGQQLLPPDILTLAGLGRQILHWERQSAHCSRCGAATERVSGGWGKRCLSCQTEHFPHIHPCAIVLVKRGNEILLTRKREWAPGRYGLVAGFLDFGESLEECAIREVFEETGIKIRNVRYVASQNWPFPAQLMAGFVADYDGGEIVVDQHELEDARWFRIDALPTIPPRRSIARWIIDNFAK